MKGKGKSSLVSYIMQHSHDLVFTMDAEGRFLELNKLFSQFTGLTTTDVIGQPVDEYISSKGLDNLDKLKSIDPSNPLEEGSIHIGDKFTPIKWSAGWAPEESLFLCIVQQIEKPLSATHLEITRESELNRLLGEQSSDKHALLNEKGDYLYVAGRLLHTWGYEPGELIGRNAFSRIHPDDLEIAEKALSLVQTTLETIILDDIRLRTAKGEWRWVKTTVSNQLANPAIKALFITSRDITQQKLSQLKLSVSERRFRSLFENHPDLVVYQNEKGIILDANPAFLSFLDKQKEEVIDISMYDFLPESVVPLFKEKLVEAFRGNKVQFKVNIDFELQGTKVFNVVKVPLTDGDKVVAVHAFLTDITAVTEAHQSTEQQAFKLKTIFESITDAFFTLDRNWNFTYINQEFERLIHIKRDEIIGKNVWKVFPEEVGGNFYEHYLQAVQEGRSAHFEAFLKRVSLWLEVKVFPSEEGLTVYFADITDKVNAKNELERLSLVASKTTNSVIITDAQGLIEWVNEAFTKLTGYTLPEVLGKKPGDILQGPETNRATIKEVAIKLQQQEPFTYEILNYKKSGEKFWFLKDVTPIFNQAGELINFISVQNDVTAKKFAEEELKKLSLVASKASNGVIITDAAGYIDWVNEGFTQNSGYTLSEVIGKKPSEFLQGPGTDPIEVERMREKLKEGVPFNSMLLNYRKSGEAFWISMDINPVFDEQGKLIQFIAIQKDITLRKEAENQLVKMTQDLYQQNRDLQQFTYIISHNLRAPVANVLGLTQFLLSIDKNSERFTSTLSFLKESVSRIDVVLKDISGILSIRDKDNILKKEPIAIAEICEQVLEDLLEPIRQTQTQLDVHVEYDIVVEGNRGYLYSIFHNLLTNALKYRSEERTLRIRIEAKYKPKGGVYILFSDNGSGFDLEKAGDNLFKLYKRFHSNKDGKGIGLFLVKAHVESLGGRIEVDSQVNVGTTFIIHLD